MKFKGSVPNIKQTDMVWVVAVNSIGFGLCMFFAGPVERKLGSRLSILLSSFLMRYVSEFIVKTVSFLYFSNFCSMFLFFMFYFSLFFIFLFIFCHLYFMFYAFHVLCFMFCVSCFVLCFLYVYYIFFIFVFLVLCFHILYVLWIFYVLNLFLMFFFLIISELNLFHNMSLMFTLKYVS